MKNLEDKNEEPEELLHKFPFLKYLHKYGSTFSPKKQAFRISAIYITLGCLWVLLSDRMIIGIFKNKNLISLISIVKGWFFVLASGLGIYALIYYTLKRINQAEKKVIQSYDELSATYEELEASYEEIAASEEEIKRQFDSLQTYSGIISASESRLNRAQSIAKVGNWELDIASNTLWASDEAFRIYGIKQEGNCLPLHEAQKRVNAEDRKRVGQALLTLLEKNEKYDIEFGINKLADGDERIVHSVAQVEFDRSGKPQKVLGVLQDITENKRNEEKLKYLAFYDRLTDLPNRVLFMDLLNEARVRAIESNTKIAVVFFDIDKFKTVNDLLGHFIGDKLLIDVSNKLKAELYPNKTLSRFSGDEFTVFIENISQPEQIMTIVDKIKKIFEMSFNIENHTLHISSSFGIALFPDHGECVAELLKNADRAMYKAKSLGRNNYQFYDENIRDEVSKKLEIEKHLCKAVEKNELYLCFQPQVDAVTNRIRGFEALLRWASPHIKISSPLEFISVAEETGLIIPIGEWVLKEACRKNKQWQETYNFFSIISVNISPVQLTQTDFAQRVKAILDETGLNPQYLELEITENILIQSFDIVNMLWELKSLGVKIALDDFGTGFSSLNYLTKLPLNTLKIDKTFVDFIRTGEKEKAVTETLIPLMHKLELEVIAEGVETIEQLEYLIGLNCDNIQGFLFSRPLIEQDLSEYLEKGVVKIN